jgi:hypothetical protein
LCARCRAQVLICRGCDRGNIYCSGKCSQIRRRETKRRASKNYQKTFKGRVKHAECQGRHRASLQEKVTDQGSQDPGVCDSLVNETTKPLIIQATEIEPAVSEPADEEQAVSLPARAETEASLTRLATRAAMQHCHSCGAWCGPFVRLEAWQGGRYYRQRRGVRHDHTRRDRSVNSPVALRGKVAKKYNS